MAPCFSGIGDLATTSSDSSRLFSQDRLIQRPEYLHHYSTSPVLDLSHAKLTKLSRSTKKTTQRLVVHGRHLLGFRWNKHHHYKVKIVSFKWVVYCVVNLGFYWCLKLSWALLFGHLFSVRYVVSQYHYKWYTHLQNTVVLKSQCEYQKPCA